MCLHYADILSGLNNIKVVTGLADWTITEYSLNFILEKLTHCHRNHLACNKIKSTDTLLPNRVIAVGSKDENFVRLLELHVSDKRASYIALSHSWGSTPMAVKCTESTISHLKEGIKIKELPKTFQHAIHMTRHLQVEYLWIDSLCIIQDLPSDWAEEASKMQDVYRNAFCTLAATGGNDSTSGFQFLRNHRTIEPFLVDATWESQEAAVLVNQKLNGKLIPGQYYCMDFDFWRDQVEEAPLNRRAWVMQERILSKRTVHFSSKQVLWQCCEEESCETFPERLPDWSSPRSPKTAMWSQFINSTGFQRALDKVRSVGHDVIPQSSNLSDLYRSWDKLIKTYSTCGVTRGEDRFVAIFSLVKEMGLATGDEWIAGFWKSQLPESLCWSVEWESPYLRGMIHNGEPLPSPRPQCWRAPSWSWAASNLPIYFHASHGPVSRLATVKEVVVETQKTGIITKGFIRLQGPLYTGVPSPRHSSWQAASDERRLFNFGPKLLVGADVILDNEGDARPEHLRRLHFFPLSYCTWTEDGATRLQGILLKPTGLVKGVFMRCGTFRIADRLTPSEMFRGAQHENWVEYESSDGTENGYTICIV